MQPHMDKLAIMRMHNSVNGTAVCKMSLRYKLAGYGLQYNWPRPEASLLLRPLLLSKADPSLQNI